METIEQFIQKLESEFEDLQPGTLQPGTIFRNVPNWSSMHALIIIAKADTEYGVRLTGEDIRSCQTVQDIYRAIESKQA